MSLTVLITSADGVTYRLGPDEPDAAWVPEGLNYTTSLPGGDKDCTFNLRRRIDEDVPLRLRDEVEVIDEDGATRWSGRIAGLPRQHGNDFLLNVQCVGWAAHLTDDESFREIYIDQDLTKWESPSPDRRINLTGRTVYEPQLGRGMAGQSRLSTGHEGAWTVSAIPISEAWYDAQGISLGEVWYGWTRGQFLTGAPPNDHRWDVNLPTDGLYSAGDSTGDLQAVGPGTGAVLSATADNRKFAMVRLFWNTTAGGLDGLRSEVFWDTLAVLGRHGITVQGVLAAGTAGLFIDDILANALARAAPKLNFTTGDGGTIQRPSFIAQQASYADPGPVVDIVLDLNKYVLWEWLVYDKTFYYRPADPDRLTWEARLDKGAFLSLEGDDDERNINGVVVSYQLPDGTKKTAGPVGSGMQVESAALADPNPDNSATVHGYQRAWKRLAISFPTYDDAAVTIGSAYLAETSLPSRSGDITITGRINHPTKGERPVREVRSGDWVKLTDFPADQPRRIIQTSYSEDRREVTVTVGNDVKKVDALLEQLGVLAGV